MQLLWRLTYYGDVRLYNEKECYASFETKRAAKLLVLLALSKSGTRRREVLADLLWPDDFQDSTRLRLRQELSRLRRAMGDAAYLLEADTDTVTLNKSEITSDLDILTSKEYEPGEDLMRILSSPFLPGWDDSWAEAERVELDEWRVRAAESVATRLLEEQKAAEAIEYARLGARIDSTCESLRLLAINAHAALGSLSGAVAEYRRLRRSGMDTPVSIDSYRQAQTEPVVSAQLPKAPHPIDRFYGRSGLLNEILDFLEQPSQLRLMTLVGAGGMGKTRIALEAIQRASVEVGFVSFVECPIEADPVVFLQELVFDGHAVDNPLDVLTRHWSGQKTTLVLDNLEHLKAPGELVVTLLKAIPDLKLVVTSRRPMKVAGEKVLTVKPLDLVNEALPLLIDLLGYSDRSEPRDPHLKELAERCDGIPLPLRLAAARLRFLEPKELLQELDDISSLRAEVSDLPVRQRDLRKMLSVSLSSLDQVEADALLKIAQFPAGVTRAIARNFLGGAVDDILERLLDSAFIWIDDSESPLRFRLLEPVRQFLVNECSMEQLAEAKQTMVEQMMIYCSQFKDGWTLNSVDEVKLHRREALNIRAALDQLMSDKDPRAHRMFRLIWHHELSNGKSGELLTTANQLKEWPDATCANKGQALLCMGWCYSARGKLELASETSKESYDQFMLTDDEAHQCYALASYHEHSRFRLDWNQIAANYELVIPWAKKVAYDLHISVRLWRGLVLSYRQDWAEAQDDLEFSYRYALEHNNSSSQISAGMPLLMIDHAKGNHEQRRSRMCEIRRQAEIVNDPHQWSFFLRSAARFALVDGDFMKAEQEALRGLEVFAFAGNILHELEINVSLARAYLGQSRLDEARKVIRGLVDAVPNMLRRVSVLAVACSAELALKEGNSAGAVQRIAAAFGYMHQMKVCIPIVELDYMNQLNEAINQPEQISNVTDEDLRSLILSA